MHETGGRAAGLLLSALFATDAPARWKFEDVFDNAPSSGLGFGLVPFRPFNGKRDVRFDSQPLPSRALMIKIHFVG